MKEVKMRAPSHVKKRKSNKPEVVQAAVIAKRVSGESQRQIAKDLGISRSTVGVILSEAELGQFVDRSKAVIFSALPKIAETYAKGAAESFERSESALERLKVIPTRDAAGSVNFNNFIGIGNLRRPDDRKPVLPEPKAT
jgi:DNA-binding transcriptional regulator LsrR (DeoR family)